MTYDDKIDELEVTELAKELARLKNKRFKHDPFGKHIFNIERGKKLVRYLFRNKPAILNKLDVDNLQLGQTSFTDKKLNRHSVDIHYVIPIKDDKDKDCVVSVLFELKAQNNRWTILQMVVYIVTIWMSLYRSIFDAAKRKDATVTDKKRRKNFLLPTVIPVILYQGGKKFSSPIKLSRLIRTMDGLDMHTLEVEAILIDLSCLREEDEPDDLDLWVPFHAYQMVNDKDPELRLMEIVDRMLPELHYPAMQELLVDVMNYGYFTNPQLTDSICEKIKSYTEKKGKIKMPVCLFDRMLEENRKAVARTKKAVARTKKAVARTKEAVARTKEAVARTKEVEARIKKAKVRIQKVETEKDELLCEAREIHVKAILGFLRYRFGDVSDKICEKIQTINDLELLRELSDFVEVCPTMDVFKKKIAKIRN
ncbi:MAG: Rpn family recombination-promoting nuclease/putative transposase [Planctomycetaceae bacterium]|jgi:hypothetical protein|nr:Rpn family recombination-promoting nuclease/putative transposase [Planctomycetaceae bacterium]